MDLRALIRLHARHGRMYPKGMVIFSEGDPGEEFYVILSGAVEIVKERAAPGGPPERYVLGRLDPGSFFGEMSTFMGELRSATAVALEDTAVLYFDQQSAVRLILASPEFGLGIIRTLCARLRTQDERTVAAQAVARKLTQRRGPGSPPTASST